VERAPRAPELLSRGVHEATGTFDIGNPNLRIEVAKSIEAGIRRAVGPFRFEATAYYTRFDDFIFRQLTGETCEDTIDTCTPVGAGGDLNQAVWSQRDAIFRGADQAQIDVAPLWTGTFGIEGQYDFVRATFTDGSNVPRIPPVRYGGGVFWRDANWLARVFLLRAEAQNDIAANETPTGGYDLLKAELSYTKKLRPSPNYPTKARPIEPDLEEITVGISGNNLLNDDIRNSVSFKKDEVLLPGRSVKFFANARF
jgi:iron complex outermembrane recepter protein